MGNEQDPEALALQVDEQVEDVDARRSIEHAYDLVRYEELDLEQQRASDQEALLLATRELVRELVEDVSGVEGNRFKSRLDLAVPLLTTQLGKIHAADHLEDTICFVKRVVGAEGVLEDTLYMAVIVTQLPFGPGGDIGSLKIDGPGRQRAQAEDYLAERGLPAAALTYQRDDLSPVDVETNAAQYELELAAECARPVDLGDVLDLQHAHDCAPWLAGAP